MPLPPGTLRDVATVFFAERGGEWDITRISVAKDILHDSSAMHRIKNATSTRRPLRVLVKSISDGVRVGHARVHAEVLFVLVLRGLLRWAFSPLTLWSTRLSRDSRLSSAAAPLFALFFLLRPMALARETARLRLRSICRIHPLGQLSFESVAGEDN